jgi:hypothetical protein
MGIDPKSQEPPVFSAWYRGEHVARQGRMALADPERFDVWYPFRECYFANGGAYPGDGQRSLYLRFAALTETGPHARRKSKPTERELLRFARRYGLPNYCGQQGEPVAPCYGGGYPLDWMVEDSRRMSAWVSLWEAVASGNAKSVLPALADLRVAQTACLARPAIRIMPPVAWSLTARPQGKGKFDPYDVAAFFRPPVPTPEVRRALEGAEPLTFSRMVVWGVRVTGGQPAERLGAYSLPDVQAAWAALISPNPKDRNRVFDAFEKAFRQSDSCKPSDVGVLWFGDELLRHFANWAVSAHYRTTTSMHFPGHEPSCLEEAMEVMFALDVLGGLIVRRCNNPRCHHSPFFTPDDPRQRFCCEACNNADRANRRRQEQKKHRQQGL